MTEREITRREAELDQALHIGRITLEQYREEIRKLYAEDETDLHAGDYEREEDRLGRHGFDWRP